jgi:hypothetical protein
MTYGATRVFPRLNSDGSYDPKRHQVSFRTAWRNLVREAGLKGLRFHDNRHNFRSDPADADVDDQTAMALLGLLRLRSCTNTFALQHENDGKRGNVKQSWQSSSARTNRRHLAAGGLRASSATPRFRVNLATSQKPL